MHTPLTEVDPVAANPLLEPSPGLMIWTLVTFAIVLWVLSRYVLGPVSAQIEKRRSEIAQSIEEAENSRDEALSLLEEYKARLAEARKEADVLREQGRKEGEREGRELVSQAQQQRERVLADADAQLDAQTRAAANTLRDEVVDLAMLAAEKVSQKSLDDEDHRRLIRQAIEQADLSSLRRDDQS
jgi:F-type H+-transporting ATPase subunit b